MSAPDPWTTPGIPGGRRHFCVYAWCPWFVDVAPHPSHFDLVRSEGQMQAHLDQRHGGWTMAELPQRAMAAARDPRVPHCWLCTSQMRGIETTDGPVLFCPECDLPPGAPPPTI